MIEYGTMINNQLIKHKSQQDSDKPIIYTDIPTQNFACTYAWEERADGIYQVWAVTDIPIAHDEQTAYTAEQLEQMTSSELREICSEMGISGTMTKANMISLIMGKQSNSL